MDDRRRAWTTTLWLWLATVFVVAYEIVPASVLPLVRTDLGVDAATGSWIVSAILLSMAIFSLPAGVVLDRVDERRAIGVAAIAFFATTIWAWLAGSAGSFPSLLAARFAGGAALVALWTASVDVVGASFDADRQGTAIAFLATGVPGGYALGHLTGPVLANAFGWPATFPPYGALTVLFVGFYLIGSRRRTVATGSRPPTGADLRRVFGNDGVWTVGALAFAAFSLNLLFNSWLPTYFVERFSVSVAWGGALAAGFPLVGVVARATSGVVSDRYFGARRRPLVLGSFLAVAVLVPAIVVADRLAAVLAVLVVAGFVTQTGLVLLLPLVRELVAENVAATALAVLNTVGFLGAFSAPIVTGALIDRAGFDAAFAYAVVLAVGGTALALRIREPT